MTSAVSLAQSASAGVTLGFKNRLINSDFTVWQRGTSLTFTSGAYTADMWIIEPRSSQSCIISQSTDVPAGQGFGYSGRFTATGGALQGFHIRTAIENPAAGNFGEFQPGTTWTFSLWAKSAFTGVAITPVFFLSSNAISNPNASVGLNGGSQTIASTWTRYTWTVTMPTWTTDAGNLSLCNQLTIRLLVGAGSQDLYITGAQMEPGTIATSFDRRPVYIQSGMCQRYLQVFPVNSVHIINRYVNVGLSSGGQSPSFTLPVTMRASPSAPNATFQYDTWAASGGYSGSCRINTTPNSFWPVYFSVDNSNNLLASGFFGASNTSVITLSAEL
jgi:hypothetical protein